MLIDELSEPNRYVPNNSSIYCIENKQKFR